MWTIGVLNADGINGIESDKQVNRESWSSFDYVVSDLWKAIQKWLFCFIMNGNEYNFFTTGTDYLSLASSGVASAN